MGKNEAIEEIKKIFSENFKHVHKKSERIPLFRNLIKKSEESNLNAFTECFRGYLEWTEGNYEKAIEHFSKSTGLDENLAYSWHGWGAVFDDLKKYEKAIECFQRAIDIDNDFAYPWNGLGYVHVKLKEYGKAMEYYTKAIDIDKKNSYPWNGLGYLNVRLGEYGKAIEYYKKAIDIDEKNSYPWNGLGNVYNILEEYEKAIEYYKKAINIDEKNSYPWNGMGNVYINLGNYGTAFECYQKSIELDENNPFSWYFLGNAYLSKKEYEKAESAYKISGELFEKEKEFFWFSAVKSNIDFVQNLLQSQLILKKKGELRHPDPATKVLNATIEQGIEEKALENKKSFLSFIDEKSDEKDEEKDYFQVLRRWNSYTPIIADNYHISKGGGYFLKVDGQGIVIDPGFNFIDNFKGAGHFFDEIDTVLVSHAHNDHTADLESILTLLYKFNKEIKDSTDPQKENTIRKKIAQRRNCDINAVTSDEIEREFLNSRRRKIIDFYMTNSVFKKFSGLFELSSTKNYKIHCIEEGEIKKLNNLASFEVIAAKHRDIISDTDSVGFIISMGDTALIYSGDTGWSEKIEENYKRVIKDYNDKYKLLVAHLGGFKETEINYMNENADREKVFYPNHLGRLGLVRINEIVKPKICFISEFGEELKGYRIKIAKIYQEAFDNKIIFFPADIGLTFNFKSKMIEAVAKVNLEKYELSKAEVKPGEIEPCLLRKDYSLHYFKKDGDFTESELTQVLDKKYDNSNR
jgi:tetratricopeptide (TPR) repeat protein